MAWLDKPLEQSVPRVCVCLCVSREYLLNWMNLIHKVGAVVHLDTSRSSSKVKVIGKSSRSEDEKRSFFGYCCTLRCRMHSESPEGRTKRARNMYTIFSFSSKNDTLLENFRILFQKDWSEHRSTCCVQILWNLADGKSVKSCVP